jgi:uncharacterized protein YndB with AHSA1/START domain
MVGAVLGAAEAHATVADSTAAGFRVRYDQVVRAAPDSVWRALGGIGRWWDPEHTYSGDAGNLSIELKPGGCFCERLAEGGGVVHMTVVYARPGLALRLVGALGPLQADGVAGSMTWTLAPDPAGTRLRLEYVVGGYLPGGLVGMAAPVDRVLGEQFLRLKLLVETGRPAER